MDIHIKEIFTTKSNSLSFFRLLLAIPLWILFDYLDTPWGPLVLFSICILVVVTDLLDGYLARKYNEVTEMGKIIDPLADKVVVAAIMIKIYMLGIIPAYYFFLIIARDLIIFLGGIFVTKKIGKVLPSNKLGKATMLNIGIVILLVILKLDWNNYTFLTFYYLSIVLLLLSLFGYVYRGIEFVRATGNNEK